MESKIGKKRKERKRKDRNLQVVRWQVREQVREQGSLS
jgi:hypothetical protein